GRRPCRLGKFIVEQLEIKVHSIQYWTDSMTVMKWIRSEARQHHQFVANRIGNIQELSNADQWSWIPTKSNVADDATREGVADLSSSSRSWRGPALLRRDNELGPTE